MDRITMGQLVSEGVEFTFLSRGLEGVWRVYISLLDSDEEINVGKYGSRPYAIDETTELNAT